jgi:hypothetical protein|tara:strand:+ start:1171 stop:1428 length:258 start_codon:yes stop_codon:yes gene_type:complete
MKITKSELQQIIKEELTAVLNETTAPYNMIDTIASYFVEIGEYNDYDFASEMVLAMSDDEVVDLFRSAQDYFGQTDGDDPRRGEG